jgi:hypothetical protein
LIWIHFQNPQIGINTRFENSQTYKEFLRLDKNWTPIELKFVEIHIRCYLFLPISSQEFNSLFN